MNKEQEQALIDRALEDESVKAFVLIMGSLLQLDSDRARLRVLRYVTDKLDEQREQEPNDV